MVIGAPVGCREIHATARLGRGGRFMVRFNRRVSQATRGRVTPAASCTGGGSQNWRGS
jgi:hypothetical protein